MKSCPATSRDRNMVAISDVDANEGGVSSIVAMGREPTMWETSMTGALMTGMRSASANKERARYSEAADDSPRRLQSHRRKGEKERRGKAKKREEERKRGKVEKKKEEKLKRE